MHRQKERRKSILAHDQRESSSEISSQDPPQGSLRAACVSRSYIIYINRERLFREAKPESIVYSGAANRAKCLSSVYISLAFSYVWDNPLTLGELLAVNKKGREIQTEWGKRERERERIKYFRALRRNVDPRCGFSCKVYAHMIIYVVCCARRNLSAVSNTRDSVASLVSASFVVALLINFVPLFERESRSVLRTSSSSSTSSSSHRGERRENSLQNGLLLSHSL